MNSNSYTFNGTPGPWKYSEGRLTRVFGNGFCLCELTGGEAVRDKRNAQLIAAAPELFEALQAMLQSHKTSGMSNGAIRNAEEQAHSALAKAVGEDQWEWEDDNE